MTNLGMASCWLVIGILAALIGGGYFLARRIIRYRKKTQILKSQHTTFASLWRQLRELEKNERYSVWNQSKYSKWFCLMKQYHNIQKKIVRWVSSEHFTRSFLWGHSTIFNEHIAQCEKFIGQLKKLEDTIWEEMQDEPDVKLYTIVLMFLVEVQDYRKNYIEKLLGGLQEQKAWLWGKENPPPK